MSRFSKKASGASIPAINLAGGKAFSLGSKTELLHAVLTTFLEDKFYESGNDRIERIVRLVHQVDTQFVARLAVVARKEFHLRSVFHLIAGELSKVHRGDDLLKRVIEKGVERPDDMTEIAAYLEGKLSKQVKRGLRHAILKFSPFQLAKYRGEGKSMKLVDVFNLVHPKAQFATPEQKSAWADLMDGKLKSQDTWEARLSSGEDKTKVWRDLVLEEKIGYMALLRNLRNIEKDGDAETKKKAAQMISDPERVKKSKQLPFRFWNAYQNVSDRLFHDAIAKAMDASVANVPELDGETLIGIDGSGSMGGDPIEKASILAAALIKKSNSDVVIYDTRIKVGKFNGLDSVISTAEKIQRETDGGGTMSSLVFDYAKKTGKPYKRIIIISDNESWQEGWRGEGVQETYNRYRKNNDCFVYAIDIQGYGTTDVSGGKVEHIVGFSERIFDFMATKERGLDTLEKYIENYEL